MSVNDLRIIESNYLGKMELRESQRSQKRRRHKPWAKRRYTHVWVADRNIYKTPFGFICHPVMAQELRRALEAKP